MKPSVRQRLESNGWVVECYSPFEMRHEDGSFASGQAAEMVMFSILDDWYGDGLDEEAERKYNSEVEFDKAEADFQRERRPENDYDYER